MKLFRSLFAVCAAGSVALSAADLAKVIEVKRWEPAECTVVAAPQKLDGAAAMLVTMPIDHKGGEKKYPIGWPRLYLHKMLPGETDWSGAQAVQFKVYADFKGTSVKIPLTFHVATKGTKGLAYGITTLVNHKTVTVTVPLAAVKNLAQVHRIGFSISESNYKHGELLKFTVGDFRLIKK